MTDVTLRDAQERALAAGRWPRRWCFAVIAAALAAFAIAGSGIAWSTEQRTGKAPPAAAAPGSGDAYNIVGHGGPVKAIRITADGARALTGSFDYAMMLWDMTATPPKELRRLEDHEGSVNAVAFLAGGRRAIAAGDDGAVWVWDLESGALVHRFAGHTAKIVAVALSADGRWAATASWDRSARLWDLDALQPGPVLEGHGGPVNAVAFSGDGDAVYTASADGTIRSWARETGALKRAVYRHGWGINVLERLPDGEQLLFGAVNGAVGVIDVETDAEVRTLQSHEGPVLALALIDKPGLAASGGGDGLIRVWRIGDWTLLEEHHNPYGPIWAMAFAERGARIYYGGLDDFVTMWQVRPREPFESVESEFPRRFQVGEGMSLGQKQFARKCSICHTLQPDGKNRAGPTLYNLFGRKAGSLPGYPYSDALKQANIVWTEETIAKLFDIGPEHFTPGTKMPLQRIADPRTRDALVAFLKAATSDRTGGQAAGERATTRTKE